MVTRHIATDQAQVQPQSSPFGIYVVDRVALGQIFLGFSVSPFIIPLIFHNHTSIVQAMDNSPF